MIPLDITTNFILVIERKDKRLSDNIKNAVETKAEKLNMPVEYSFYEDIPVDLFNVRAFPTILCIKDRSVYERIIPPFNIEMIEQTLDEMNVTDS